MNYNNILFICIQLKHQSVISIACVGALYDTSGLPNHIAFFAKVAWDHTKHHLDVPKPCNRSAALWLIQTIVLLIFSSLNNDTCKNINHIHSQLKALVKLVNTSKLNHLIKYLYEHLTDKHLKNDLLRIRTLIL